LGLLLRFLYVDGTNILVFEPKATISGVFDAGVQGPIRVQFTPGTRFTSIMTVPEKSKPVLLVLEANDGKYSVTRNFVSFMPDSTPLVSVTGFSDPRVDQCLARIRKERAKDNPSDWSPIRLPPRDRAKPK
jgi:hypothetical protein